MPHRLETLHDEGVYIGSEIENREAYIAMLESENLRLRLRLKIIVGGYKGLIIWGVSFIVAGVVTAARSFSA